MDSWESCLDESNSKLNEQEAYHVAKICRDLLAGNALLERDLGIITPYRAQIDAIKKALEPESTIYCESVDKFQGQEREMHNILVRVVELDKRLWLPFRWSSSKRCPDAVQARVHHGRQFALSLQR